jgi:DMSO/TMAO reductase YedYZ molybdopterin-dependent catalytic subunit
MKKAIGVVMALGFIILTILIAVTGCEVSKTMDKSAELKSVEVREYQGEKLSSITALRENSIKGPQNIDKEKYRLSVTGLVANSKDYTYEQVINDYQNYKKVVMLNCVEGWSVNILWEGVLLKDLLAEANPSPNAKVVIFHAYDGYTTSLPLEYVVGKNLLLAYKMNDVVLPPERGFPFHLVAESKWGYKWIKWVTKIELSDNINYKGYWEERGYSNNGDLNANFFDN